MLTFRFEYSADKHTSLMHGFTAPSKIAAFEEKNRYLIKIKGKYVAGSMQVFENNAWQPVPDPLLIFQQRQELETTRPLEM